MKKVIAINGITGVGKSTIGKKLADKLNYYFIDSDQEIEDLLGKTINQVFADHGENYFRQIEKNLILDIMSRDEKFIIALGGGSYMDQDTRSILQKKALTVWLNADLETIIHRLKNKNNRPLLNGVDKRKVLANLMNKRTAIYQKSDIKIDIGKKDTEVIVEEIIRLISKHPNAF